VLAHDCSVGDEGMRPAGIEEDLAFRGADEAADDDGRASEVCTQDRDVAGVWVRRTGFGERVIAVVPHDDQADIVHRREDRGACPNDGADGTAADCKEAAVALCWSQIRVEDNVMLVAHRRAQCDVDAVGVAAVRHDDNGTAAG
jgi:hypothetical protein